MNYDEDGHGGPDFEVIGPDDDKIEDFLRENPTWSDDQVSAELTRQGLAASPEDVQRARAWI